MSKSTLILSLLNRCLLLLLCGGLFYMTGCDSSTSVDEDDGDEETTSVTLPPLPADDFSRSSEIEFQINLVKIKVDSVGDMKDATWHAAGVDSDTLAYGIFSTGLWLASEQNGVPQANMVWVGTYPRSNFAATGGGQSTGVYFITPNGVDEAAAEWPVEYGAPVDASGNPRVYGDAMAWSSLTSKAVANQTQLAEPLENLRVTQAVFGYRQQDALRDMLFVRYEITNTSTEAWNDIYAGVHSDNDFNIQQCGCFDASANSTGYDMQSSATYTYVKEELIAACFPECRPIMGSTLGFSFLETPDNTGVYSHRIMRKNNYFDPPFGEYAIKTPQHTLNALQGLSGDGQPMVNPVTGETTRFAFTGNPATGTGWIDGSLDIRSLLTTGPFSLAPGETKVLTGVYIFTKEKAVGLGVITLRDRLNELRSNPQYWSF